jgi:hypothetical protein
LEIASKNPEKIYSFLKSQNSINNDSVFVNFPFAKTKANFSENYFSLKANIFEKKQTNPTAKYIFYLSGNLAKIEENYNNITQTNSAISALFNNFSAINTSIIAEKNDAKLSFKLNFKKAKNLYEILK